MKFVEPAFDVGGELWPTLSVAPCTDISVVENTIAAQSAELNLRLTELAELYNTRQQQANELQIAFAEIDRLNQTVSSFQDTVTNYKTNAATAQNKIAHLENGKAALRAQLNEALQELKTLADRLRAMEAVFNLREAVVASALEQVGLLNSELASGTAERFKLVAAAARERSQQRNILYHQTSLLDDKVKRAEALAATQVAQLKHYEATCAKLDKRIQQLEALLKSEHEVADLKIKQLTGELQRYRLASSPTFNSPASTCAVARSEEAKVQTAS